MNECIDSFTDRQTNKQRKKMTNKQIDIDMGIQTNV